MTPAHKPTLPSYVVVAGRGEVRLIRRRGDAGTPLLEILVDPLGGRPVASVTLGPGSARVLVARLLRELEVHFGRRWDAESPTPPQRAPFARREPAAPPPISSPSDDGDVSTGHAEAAPPARACLVRRDVGTGEPRRPGVPPSSWVAAKGGRP